METKECPHCYSAIDQRAKICPSCAKPQSWAARLLYSPGTATLLGAFYLIFVFMVMHQYAKLFRDTGADFAAYREEVVVLDAHMELGVWDEEPLVKVVGQVRNDSPLSWEDAIYEVNFYDASGQLVDVKQTTRYSMGTTNVLISNDTQSYGVSVERVLPEDKYASCTVRVLDADELDVGWP